MRYLIILSTILFMAFKVNGQQYYKIAGGKHVIRYYENLKVSKDKIRDSLFLEIRKMNNDFELSLINENNKIISICLYRNTGKVENQIYTTRITSPAGTKFIKRMIKVKVIEPVNEGCGLKW